VCFRVEDQRARERKEKTNHRKRHKQSSYVLQDHIISLKNSSENGNSEIYNHESESLVYLPHFPFLNHVTFKS
jgi:hypothetical protein